MEDQYYNPVPGIETYQENMNPVVNSPYSTFSISFYQTRESLMDIDTYRSFLKNCESITPATCRMKSVVLGLVRKFGKPA